ncbi:pfs, ankyrin repeats & 6-phosphofructo-2-kinase [Metarhizium brunneum]
MNGLPVLWLLAGRAAAADDDLSDFTNNLAQDLGPLLALFGEAVTKQYLSESTTFLDYFTFAMGPLGIITAVVSVIRVCGHPSLRAFIGRSQEGEAAVEAELCASTSRDVCELFHKGGIARVLGRQPDLLELVAVSPAGGRGRGKRLEIFQDHIRNADETMYWKRSRGSVFSPDDKSGRCQMSPTPNLSLNIGIKRPKLWVVSLVALNGLVLQAGIIVLAGFGAWRLGWNKYHPDNATARDYAPRMFIAGSLLLSLGMWGCAVLIGQATQEVRFRRDEQAAGHKTRLIWLQPGPQLVGEQSFDPSSFFESEKQPLEYWVSSRKRKGSERLFEVLTFLAVLASVVGYILQFIGLRGMNAWLSLAQLGVTLYMSMLRGALRIQRLQNHENKLSKIPDLVAGHELDWLAYELAFDDSPMQATGQPQKGANWHIVSGKMPSDDKPMTACNGGSFELSGASVSSRRNSCDKTSLREFIGSQGCSDLYYELFDLRVQLSGLTGNQGMASLATGSGGGKPWKSDMVAVRKSAIKLAEALGEIATALFSGENRAKRSDLTVPVEALAHTDSEPCCSSTLTQVVGVEMKAPEPTQPKWRVNAAHIEAILGLWTWSLVSSQDVVGDSESPNTSASSKDRASVSHQILAAGLDNEYWNSEVDIEVELNFWFGPNTHLLSRESLRLGKGMKCDNFTTLCRQLTGSGGWEKLPKSTESSSSLLSCSKTPIFQLRLFGWNILCESLAISGTDPVGASDVVKLQSSQDDSHVSIGVQYLRSERSIIDLCTQQLLITLVKNLISLAALPIPESIVSEKEGFIQLQNPLVATFEKAFVDSEIGSRTDAITTIIPQLRRQLLPSDENLISSLVQSANTFRQKGEWARAAVLLKWGCRHFSPEHMRNRHADRALQWQFFERILRVAAEFYRYSATLKSDKMGISYAQDGLREMRDMCHFMPLSSEEDSVEPCQQNITSMLACYADVFDKLAAETSRPRKANGVHPFVQAIDDGNRVDALYELSFLSSGDFGSKSLKPALPLAIRNQWTEVVDALFEMRVHPDSEDEAGRTAASHCAELGHVSLLRELAARGAFLDQSDNMARTPLHWAALSGQDETVAVLLETGNVDISRRDQDGVVPFWHAIEKNHHSIVRALLDRGFAVDARRAKLNFTPIYWTAQHGQVEIVQHLVQSGAEVNKPEWTYGFNPLHNACENNHEDVVRVLLEAGADPNARTANSRTPLHLAAAAGSTAIVRILLDLGVDVNTPTEDGRTAIHYAASEGRVHLLKMLIDAGADIERGDDEGRRPIHTATRSDYFWSHPDAVFELLKLGAVIDPVDKTGHTPLCLAAGNGQAGIVEELLSRGANVNHADKYGQTPLYNAARKERFAIVKRLLEVGADVHCRDEDGNTALIGATDSGGSELVQLLLEHGAVDVPRKDGATALSIARSNRFYSTEEVLLQSGNYLNSKG